MTRPTIEPWRGWREEWRLAEDEYNRDPKHYLKARERSSRSRGFVGGASDFWFAAPMVLLVAAALVYLIGMGTIMHDQNECRRANPDYEQTGNCK